MPSLRGDRVIWSQRAMAATRLLLSHCAPPARHLRSRGLEGVSEMPGRWLGWHPARGVRENDGE